jgi:glucose-6-phosphate 1-dehydrogenase
VVLEKPLGTDLASASRSTRRSASTSRNPQIYRIDHYLGKETVQNLMVLRFGNSILEPLWRAPNISSVQITVAEEVGVGSRAGFYDGAGAMRDMVQNHLLQLLCIVAMEPPTSLNADAVRDEKLKVLRSLRRFTLADIARDTVRGQYTARRQRQPGSAGLPRRKERPGGQQDRDLRGPAHLHRHLALVQGAVLPAHRQAHAAPLVEDRDRIPIRRSRCSRTRRAASPTAW